MNRGDYLRELAAELERMPVLMDKGGFREGASREPSPDRVGWPCACGCMQVVPPFTGKGQHPRAYATAACSNRARQRKLKAKRKQA